MSRSVRLTFVNGYPSLDPLESLRVRRGLFEDAPSHLCWGEGPMLWKRELTDLQSCGCRHQCNPVQGTSYGRASTPQWELCLFRYRRDGEGMRRATEAFSARRCYSMTSDASE